MDSDPNFETRRRGPCADSRSRWRCAATVAASLLTGSLAGCATVDETSATTILEADIFGVEGCEDLGRVEGHGQVVGQKGVETAKIEAKARARELQATHVVFYLLLPAKPSLLPNPENEADAFARAYRCPAGHP